MANRLGLHAVLATLLTPLAPAKAALPRLALRIPDEAAEALGVSPDLLGREGGRRRIDAMRMTADLLEHCAERGRELVGEPARERWTPLNRRTLRHHHASPKNRRSPVPSSPRVDDSCEPGVGKRLPIVGPDRTIRALVHRSLLIGYAARQAEALPTVLQNKTINDLSDEEKRLLQTFALVAANATLAGPARAPFGRTIDRLDTGGAVTAFVVFVASAVHYRWSVGTRWSDARGDDGGAWQWLGVVLVALATLLGIAYALFHRWRGRLAWDIIPSWLSVSSPCTVDEP
jgi:hypothetical protein